MRYKCLSIAGFDGSGGAGIQADLKTFAAWGCYGMTVLTALPVQNTCGVRKCYDLAESSIREQLEAIFEDIPPDSIKVGMLFSQGITEIVADFLEMHAQNIPIVLDPVMIAKSGDRLLDISAIETLKTRLFPLATILTPNLPEACALVGFSEHCEALGLGLLESGAQAVLVKGGHQEGLYADDLFMDKQGSRHYLSAPRIESPHTHGTGCTLSSAIAAALSQGCTLLEACRDAKQYVWKAIGAAQKEPLGKGRGPIDHFYHFSKF